MDERIGLGRAHETLLRLLEHGDAWLARTLPDLLSGLPFTDRVLAHSRLSARGLLLAVAALLLLLTVPPLTEWALMRFRITGINFRGERIPQSYGLAILLCAAPLLLLDAWAVPATASDRTVWLCCAGSFAALGLLDDLLGNKTVKGLRGHVSALIQRRHVTTGFVKAAGGLLCGLGIGWWMHRESLPLALLAGAVIALSANAMNLLDLRPGRACAAFAAAALLLLLAHFHYERTLSVPALLYILIPALVAWTHDADARVMLGDTGSNLLGAALGLGLCLYTGTGMQIAALAALIALHLAAERFSITRWIQGSRIISALDRLAGVR